VGDRVVKKLIMSDENFSEFAAYINEHKKTLNSFGQ
jgi:hypothetical protein